MAHIVDISKIFQVLWVTVTKVDEYSFCKGSGINWKVHGEIKDSSQIFLESYKGDFLSGGKKR